MAAVLMFYCCPTLTNYYRLDGSKQHKLTISRFCKSKVQRVQLVSLCLVSQGQSQGVGQASSLLKHTVENLLPGQDQVPLALGLRSLVPTLAAISQSPTSSDTKQFKMPPVRLGFFTMKSSLETLGKQTEHGLLQDFFFLSSLAHPHKFASPCPH